MASDSELIERLREILRTSDLTKTSTALVRRRLEEEFRIDLSEKKPFLREQVELFLRNEFVKSEEAERDEDDDRTVEEAVSEQTDGSDSKRSEVKEKRKAHQESRIGKRKRRSKKLLDEPKESGSGFSRLCTLSPKLQEFIGVPKMARTEVVELIWLHIREKNLQDPSDKQNIICDETLRALFGADSINVIKMNKALSEHIHCHDSDEPVPTKSREKKRRRKQRREESDEPEQKEAKRQRGKWGFLAPLQLSDGLTNFLATGENMLARSDVIKRMWVYIKEHNLQDPTNKKRVICDEKLKELFGVESFDGFTVTKHLSAHFVPKQ